MNHIWTAAILKGEPVLIHSFREFTWFWHREALPKKFAREWYNAVTRQGGYVMI